MKTVTKISALVLCVIMLVLSLASCSPKGIDVNNTVVLSGKVTDTKGNPASGRFIVFYSDYKTLRCEISEDGSYTVDGIILDDTSAVVIEDKIGNIYNEITYFSLIEGDKTGFSGKDGKHVSGYINVYADKDAETVYIDFERGEDDYINCSYVSETPNK